MATSEAFTIIEDDGSHPPRLFDDYQKGTSGKMTDLDVQLVTALREKHPDLIVTSVPSLNCNLLQFAAAGFATADVDEDSEPVLRWRGFVGPSHRGGSGFLADNIFFAKYRYKWNNEGFILYTVRIGYGSVQYILKEPRENETPSSHSIVTDALLTSIGTWLIKEVPAIYVFDGYWAKSTKLWEEVEKASWDDVILDPKIKKALTEVSGKFFDGKDIYDEYGVPWKRGLIFHGPVGNGKTVSLKALMRTLYHRDSPVVTLYVKSAPQSYHIRAVFQMARAMTPCLLVLEDIDTIVTPMTRSYFFNEVDGLENNDGILIIATTNHLDQLDPGLSKRPSRFDRKYLFPQPNKEERTLYAEYWRKKLKNKPAIEFPKTLCSAVADITDDFSFAYIKEAFVATLLDLARNHVTGDTSDEDRDSDDDDDDDDDDDGLDKYKFWKVFKVQVKILRDEMDSGSSTSGHPTAGGCYGHYEALSAEYEEMLPLLENASLRGVSQPYRAPILAPKVLQPLKAQSFGKAALSPLSSIDPLTNKIAKLSNGVWEWGI